MAIIMIKFSALIVLGLFSGTARQAIAQTPTPTSSPPVPSPPSSVDGKPGWTSKPVSNPPVPKPTSPPGSNVDYYFDECFSIDSNGQCVAKWVRKPAQLQSMNPGGVGANRVIKSPSGRLGVQGTFHEPVFSGGTSWKIKDGEVVGNRHGVRPTLYFGAEAAVGGKIVIIDSGLQYEPKNRLVEKAGWTLFHRITNQRYGGNKWVWKQRNLDPNGKGHFGWIKMRLLVRSDGQIGTEVINCQVPEFNGMGTGFYQPYWLNVSQSNLNMHYKVRRVIGITQSVTIVDGAKMNNAGFTNGEVAKVTNSNNRLSLEDWENWTKTDPYIYGPVAPNGDPRDPNFKNLQYPWMIDFAGPYKRNTDYNGTHPLLDDAIENARYRAETVNINLNKHPGIWKGNPKKKAKQR